MKLFLLAFCLVISTWLTVAQTLRINEIMSSNGGAVTDNDGDTSDWIEFYNAGNVPVNIKDYGLSDKKNQPFQWIFPEIQINPGQFLLVFASGKDRRALPVNWNTIIAKGDQWKYFVPSSEPSANWRMINFDDSNWQMGQSGFGYGDNDDATVINISKSIFLRRSLL